MTTVMTSHKDTILARMLQVVSMFSIIELACCKALGEIAVSAETSQRDDLIADG
jgi:hypothetical protein